jgi:hypothetical protein
MFKKIFQIIALYIFNISLFAQENDNIPQKDIDKPEENILPQEKDKKEVLIEKEGENKDKTENDKNSEDSIQQEEELKEEEIKDPDFDDNVDMSLFNINKARNFFAVSPLGIGFNGLLFSKGDWLHNGFNSFNLFTNCCKNIKKYKHKMILNNYNISFDIFQYNIIIGKGVTFFVGLNFMWKHCLFLQEDEKCIKYFSIYNNTEELKTLNQGQKESDVNININKNKEIPIPKEEKKESKKKIQQEYEEYYVKTEKDCDKEAYSISLFNIGLLTGIAWYSNLLNIKKSWFLKILLYARYQSVENFIINNENNEQERIESKYLRIRPFDLTCGLEIGYGKVSFTFFMSILPLLNEKKKYNNGKKSGKKEYTKGDNLFNCGVILKINIY